MSDIDWSLAPEWATHEGTPKGMMNSSRYWIGKNNYQCRRVNGVMNTYGKEYTWYFDTFIDLTPRPSNSLYTQAMSNHGIIPLVGMKCLYKEKGGINWRNCQVIATLRGMIWLDNTDTGSSPLNNISTLEFKPLTLPIELIDGKAYQFDCEVDGRDCIGICEQTKGYVMLNTLKGVSYNSELCTNIKLLEVKS